MIHKESQWCILSLLGQGAFGCVYKAQKICSQLVINNLDNDICAIKIIKKSVFTKNEIEILKQLDHPLIVKYHGYAVGENDDNIYIYMEYIDGYSVSSILKKQIPINSFPEDIIKQIVFDLVMILNYIHDDERKIIHRDLKCDNIMLVNDCDKEHNCNISNSGCSRNSTGKGKEKQQQQQQEKQLEFEDKEKEKLECNCNDDNKGGNGSEDNNNNYCIIHSKRQIQISCESCGSDLEEDSITNIATCRSITCIYSANKKIKLIDFGLSKGCSGDSKYYSLVGTPTHIPPEVVLRNNTACRKSDIWSLGCTIIEMAGGNLYEKDNYGRPKIPDHLTSSCKNFIQRCLTIDPAHRDDISNLMTHNFINNSNLIHEEDLSLLFEDRVKLVEEIPKKSRIEFDDEFNEVIQPGEIPSTCTEIIFGFDFNQKISIGSLDSIKTIEFGGSFNQIIPVGSLPLVETITFGARYNKPLLIGALPSVTTVNFGWTFDQELSKGVLPNTLKKLTFQEGGNYNQPFSIDSLPNSLKTLILGDYDSIIPINVLPNSITILELGGEFNQPLNGCIPQSVTHLSFGYAFNKPLSKNCIPSNIKFLKFGTRFNQILSPGILPTSLETLMIGYYYTQILEEGSIPFGVKTLIFEHKDKNPKKVSFDYMEITTSIKDVNMNEIIVNNLTPESLPESITKLVIGKNQYHMIDFTCLPPLISILKYHGGYPNKRSLTPRDIPSSVTALKLYNYNYEIKKSSIPKSVISLQLGSRFSKFNQIPSLVNLHPQLRDLKLFINQDELDIYNLKEIIPSTITYLNINGDIIDW